MSVTIEEVVDRTNNRLINFVEQRFDEEDRKDEFAEQFGKFIGDLRNGKILDYYDFTVVEVDKLPPLIAIHPTTKISDSIYKVLLQAMGV